MEATATTQFSMPVNLDATSATGSNFTSTVPLVDSLGNSLNVTITYTNNGGGNWGYTATIPTSARCDKRWNRDHDDTGCDKRLRRTDL